MDIIELLHAQINQSAPIDGVSIGDENDVSTWRIDFKDGVTAEQRAAALQVIAQFDMQAVRGRIQRAGGRRRAAKAEAALAVQFKDLTPQGAVDYIETNVTNLATAKAVLKIMVRILIAFRDELYPELPEE